MGLEAVTYIRDLVITNPDGATDAKAQGDEHIRNIKKALKNVFPDTFGPRPMVDSIANLRLLAAPVVAAACFALGYYTPGDLGGGIYVWSALSAAADNGGSVIRPSSNPATGRWLLQYNDQLSIGQFGAKADDATDAVAAIVACRDTGVPRVFIPSGTFRCDGPIEKEWEALGQSTTFVHQTYVGCGWNSVLKNYGSTENLFTFNSLTGSEYIYGISFEDLTLDGSGAATTGVAIWCAQQSNMRFKHVQFINHDYGAVYMQDCQSCTFSDDCFVNLCGNTTHATVHLELCTTTNFFSSRLTNNGGFAGILVNGCYGTVIRDNRIESSGVLVWVGYDEGSTNTRGTTIQGNSFEYPVDYAIQVGNGAETTYGNDTWISNNHFSLSNLADVRGIFVERTQATYIRENTFIANGGLGSYDIEFSGGTGAQIDCQLGKNRASSNAKWLLNSHAADPYLYPSFVSADTAYSTWRDAALTSLPLVVEASAFATPLTPNLDTASVYKRTLTGNLVVGAPSNPSGRLSFIFIQDGTGNRTVTWNAIYKHTWTDTSNIAGAYSTISFLWDGTNWVQDGAHRPWAL